MRVFHLPILGSIEPLKAWGMSDSLELVQRWRDGDEEAAAEIFDRYVHRVLALARTRLSPQFQRRIDPEDVTQSACNSFFRRVRSDELVIRRSGDLWRLLAAITINKVREQVRYQKAKKRDPDNEESWAGSKHPWSSVKPDSVLQPPQADDAVALIEVVESVISKLKPRDQRILSMRLQGMGVADISSEVECAERTVRRVLVSVRETLERAL